jgi:hypothetical protein
LFAATYRRQSRRIVGVIGVDVVESIAIDEAKDTGTKVGGDREAGCRRGKKSQFDREGRAQREPNTFHAQKSAQPDWAHGVNGNAEQTRWSGLNVCLLPLWAKGDILGGGKN